MDKERECREKDAETKELRERTNTLNNRLKQMEFQAQKFKEIQRMDKVRILTCNALRGSFIEDFIFLFSKILLVFSKFHLMLLVLSCFWTGCFSQETCFWK